MKRRYFIKLGSCGIAAFAVGGLGLPAFLRPRQAMAGTRPVKVEFRHWISGRVLGRASTVLTVE